MINLWYDTSYFSGRMGGPEKLVKNLQSSLSDQKIPYTVNDDSYEKNILIQYDAIGHSKHEKLEHSSCFIGPQVWPFDPYGKFLLDNTRFYNKIIVPSKWVKDLMVNKFSCPADKIAIWAVGIEKLYSDRNTTYDCLIYSKRRSSEELEQVKSFLTKHNLEYKMIEYGGYDENEFRDLARQARFCFLLNGTESQGIAVQEMMSLGVPLFVWDLRTWEDQGSEWSVPATSVPYWDDRCGERFYDIDNMQETFDNFYARMDTYKPQNFVKDTLSYECSVKTLLEILNAD